MIDTATDMYVNSDLKTIALHARNAEYNPKVHYIWFSEPWGMLWLYELG